MTSKRTTVALVWMLASVVALAVAADARATDTADEADVQFQIGTDRYEAGDYKGALEHFLASNRLAANKNVLFNIARSYEQLRDLPNAFRYYSRALEGESDPQAAQRLQQSLARLRPSIALLRIETEPQGATVYVDRRDLGSRGTTPLTISLTPGPHKVLVESPGYEPAESPPIDLRIGRESEARLTLKPILGTLSIEGTLHAAVRLDSASSQVLCHVPCVLSTPPGAHRVFASSEGFRTLDIPVEVTPNARLAVRTALEPLMGSVVVNTDLRDALVTIDGQPRGFTPAVVSVPVGRHALQVSQGGFRSVERNVFVRNDQSVQVDIELAPQEEVVSASRSVEAIEDAPASITVITREELRAMAYPTIAEAIRGVRGMYLSYDDIYTSAGTRGFSRPGDYGNRILVLLDGHATNDNYVGSSYLGFDARVDLDDIERIEVVRGPGSAVYGTGAFFGVINLITRDRSAPTHAEASVSTALNTGRVRATGVWHPSATAGAWLSLGALRSSGQDKFYPEFVSVPTATGPSVVDWQGNASNGVARNVDGFRAATVEGRAWLGPLSVSAFLTSRYKNAPSAQYGTLFGSPDTHNADTRAFVDAQYEPHVSSTFESLTRLYLDYYHFDSAAAYLSDTASGSFGNEDDTFKGIWGGIEQRWVYKPSSRVRLTGGGDFTQHFTARQVGADDRDRPGYAGSDRGPIIDRNDRFKNVAGYALGEITLSPIVKLSGGARVDYIEKLDFEFGAAFNPRLALILKPYAGGNLKLIASKAFRAPSVYERFYLSATQAAPASLHPEQILSSEAEFTHRFTGALSLIAAAYTNYVSNLIELRSVSASTELTNYQNSEAPVLVVGTEWELRREWRQGTMFSVSYSLQKARYLHDDNLREVPNSPLHLAAVKGAVPIINRILHLATRLSFEGPRFDNFNANADVACDPGGVQPVACPSQGTTDPGLIWDLVLTGSLDRLNANYSLGAYNLMDWGYDTVPSTEFRQRTIRQRPRSVLASVTVSF